MVEADALQGARRAGPQFPLPVTRLESAPQRVTCAAPRHGRWPISRLIGPAPFISLAAARPGGTPHASGLSPLHNQRLCKPAGAGGHKH